MSRSPVSRHGLSLIEMLVVIGVTAVTMGLLLPALSAARARSVEVLCASNLRQIGLASVVRASDRGGFVQLAGNIVVEDASRPLTELVNDRRITRYEYVVTPPLIPPEHLLPYPLSLLDYLDVSDGPAGGTCTFACPDALSGTVMNLWSPIISEDAGRLYAHQNRWDYAPNEAVTGFDHAVDPAGGRARGQLVKVRDAARVVFFADADRHAYGTNAVAVFSFSPQVRPTAGLVTFKDLRDLTGRVEGVPLDRFRHRGRVNTLFVDGHVEGLRYRDELDRGILWPGESP